MSGGKTQNPPWRHHYLPEFYLKRWASNGRLVEFSKPYRDTVKMRFPSPRGTGFEDAREFLADLPLDEKAYIEETFFSPVDNRAADVLTKMECGERNFSGRERVGWTQFIMTLMFRHPTYIQHLRTRLNENLLLTTPDAERRWRKVRRPDDPKTLAEKMRLELLDDKGELSRRSLALSTEMMTSERIGSRLANMRWGSTPLHPLCRGLLTSDRPVYVHNSLEADDCHLLMPIGPKRIFWAVNTPEMARTITNIHNDDLARFMNEQVVRRAMKLVYGMSEGALPYVQQTMGVDPEFTVLERFLQPMPRDEILREKAKVARMHRREKRLQAKKPPVR